MVALLLGPVAVCERDAYRVIAAKQDRDDWQHREPELGSLNSILCQPRRTGGYPVRARLARQDRGGRVRGSTQGAMTDAVSVFGTNRGR